MSRTFNFLFYVAATAFVLVPLMAKAAERPAPTLRSGEISELNLQVLLDRAGFSPGEIDGESGKNASRALIAYREDHGIPAGKRGNKSLLLALGASSIEPIVRHKITAQEAAGPFNANIPRDMMDQSKLPGLYYRSVLEQLGEEFHAAPALLKRLNPGARFTAGEEIRVPNVGLAPRSAGASGEPAALLVVENRERVRAHSGPVKVVVSKQSSILTVYDKNNQIIFHAPVTSGSEHDPLPLGEWLITEVVRNPTYNYNPKLFWDADSAGARVTIAAGPNNPVGDVWIDLNKLHYGIHGTPEPARIGYAESHGCVRLTNWDALEVASLVAKGTPVVFEP
jgi:lipoprotein-anchoring transpeptidase ErfK/SrfK